MNTKKIDKALNDHAKFIEDSVQRAIIQLVTSGQVQIENQAQLNLLVRVATSSVLDSHDKSLKGLMKTVIHELEEAAKPLPTPAQPKQKK